MPFYVPLGPRGFLFRLGTLLLAWQVPGSTGELAAGVPSP